MPGFEILLFVIIGLFLFRGGLPSLIPLLIWGSVLFPLFPGYAVIGLAAAGLVSITKSSSFFPPHELLIGWGFGAIGLGLFAVYRDHFYSLEAYLPFILAAAILLAVVRFPMGRFAYLSLGCVAMLAGWLTLHEWTIPLALPAWFTGFFGNRWPHENPSTGKESLGESGTHATMGTVMGFLPGLGPGLAGALWLGERGSLSLISANLIFSLGFVLLEGRVRSYPAAWVSFDIPPDILSMLFLILAALVFAWGIWPLIPAHFSIPPSLWTALQWVGLLVFGGFAAIAVGVLAFSLRQMIHFYHQPPSLGMWVLLLPIIWFYA